MVFLRHAEGHAGFQYISFFFSLIQAETISFSRKTSDPDASADRISSTWSRGPGDTRAPPLCNGPWTEGRDEYADCRLQSGGCGRSRRTHAYQGEFYGRRRAKGEEWEVYEQRGSRCRDHGQRLRPANSGLLLPLAISCRMLPNTGVLFGGKWMDIQLRHSPLGG